MIRFMTDSFDGLCALNDDGIRTHSSDEQMKVEETVRMCYKELKESIEMDLDENLPILHRSRHINFLMKGLKHLPQAYECLDASRCWLVYWILHSLELLNVPIPDDIGNDVVDFLGRCQCDTGGFGGGPGQLAHLASTYPAVCALCIVGTQKAYNTINRETLADFLYRMHLPDGGFIMHEAGEEDIRGAYCAAAVAKLTNIMTPKMFDKTAEWVISCQTYEGGFSGCPSLEAHGGYSFCGLATLIILEREGSCDLDGLLRWTCNRQMHFEGGFQGRTNKLVDGCYSFWQGGAFPLLHMSLALHKSTAKPLSSTNWMFDQQALQEYILVCCQHPRGGLIDKPHKNTDFYHTMYCLSGLSVAQHFQHGRNEEEFVLGDMQNKLQLTHPIFNIGIESARTACHHFSSLH